MARVFVATETALGRTVVVKVLSPEMSTGMSVERFKREIQLVAQLRHPHIVPVHAAGEAGGMLYYTMPFVEGESLRAQLARRGELPVPEAVKLLREITDALAYAHRRGIVHRDIKPDNILLDEGHAVVADFGIAKALTAAATHDSEVAPSTATGMLVGTPQYMAPEQAAGDSATDHRADLYALGVVAYEMLSGEPPFRGRTAQAFIAAHITDAPEPVGRRRPSVPPALGDLVMRLLEKRPADRPQSADEVLRALEQASAGSEGLSPLRGQASSKGRAHRGWIVAGVRHARMHGLKYAALAVLLALIGVGVTYRSISRSSSVPEPQTTGGAVTGGAETTAEGRSIAVLPFSNLSADIENEYFSDGVTEELVTALGKIDELSVLSALSLRGPGHEPAAIGRRFGVQTVLSGSVRKSGDKLRISARLTNAADGFQLWSETYERELRDVFAVQEELARAIAGALRLRLTGSGNAPLFPRQTEDLVAYDFYLKGRYFWSKRTEDGTARAVEYFEKAIARDPKYALAYAGLADAYAIPFGGSYKDRLLKAKAAALKALALDSTLAEPHAALGLIATEYDRDYGGAEREFRRAFELDPGYATARHWYALNLAARGRLDEAIAECRRAVRLDPLSQAINTDLGQVLVIARRYGEAIEVLRNVLELDPSYVRAHGRLASAYLFEGRVADAIAEYRQAIALAGGSLPQPWGEPGLGYAYAVSGRRTEALRVLRELESTAGGRYVRPEGVAMVHVGLGNADDALRWLERAVEERSITPWWIRDPLYDPIRSDPRFTRLLRRMELEP